MNIFVTDPCPIKSAQFLDDKRIVKMVLESAQILSTNIFILSKNQIEIMRPTHANHPCTIWTRQTRTNAEWLLEHLEALLTEYTNRYSKIHLVETKYLPAIKCSMHLFPNGMLQPFVNCTTYKDIEDTCEAYRIEMNRKWSSDKRPPTWYRKTRE